MRRKSKSQTKTLPTLPAFLTPERLHHGDELVIEEDITKAGRYRARNLTQTVLDTYLHRRLLNSDQHATGCMIYALWRASECAELRASSYDVPCGGGGALTDRQAEARSRLNELLNRVNVLRRRMLIHVCVSNGWAGDFSVRAGFTGMEVLRQALDAARGLTKESQSDRI